MKTPRIKELNQRITVFGRNVTGSDSEDYPVYNETEHFTTWAKVESDGTEETETGKAAFDMTRVVFVIRYRQTVIDNTLYIRHNGLDYEIMGVDNFSLGREYIIIHAKRTVLQ